MQSCLQQRVNMYARVVKMRRQKWAFNAIVSSSSSYLKYVVVVRTPRHFCFGKKYFIGSARRNGYGHRIDSSIRRAAYVELVPLWICKQTNSITLNIFCKNIIYKNIEAQIKDFYYIKLRTLLNKELRLGLKPNVLIKDNECTTRIIFNKRRSKTSRAAVS